MALEPIQIVEIQQPLCANVFGSAPCTATGEKCFNTFTTCKDTPNHAAGTPLSLYFSRGDVAEQGAAGLPYIIPSLVSVSTNPAKINLGGSDGNAIALGTRATCRITLNDHPHTDRKVDPYIASRSYDPMSRGMFWQKWLARNLHRQGVLVKVYDGFAGDDLGDMTVRSYFVQSITRSASGAVTIEAKDILAKIEAKKAQAPEASPGRVKFAIDEAATSLTVSNAVAADYPASGTIRISGELMTYSAVTESDVGLTFTLTARGTDGSTAASHNVDDSVQRCIRYTAATIDEVLSDLLETEAGLPGAYLDTTNWTAQALEFRPFYLLTTLISEPQPVASLVSEILYQTLTFLYWDDRAALVKFGAVKGRGVNVPTLTAEGHIIAGSFDKSTRDRDRVSQVWVYYEPIDWAGSLTDATNFSKLYVHADGDDPYEEQSIRTIYSAWLPKLLNARNTGSRIYRQNVDMPTDCSFSLSAKDRAYWVGDTVYISHPDDVNQYGARNVRPWLITSAEESLPGERVDYTATDLTPFGQVHYVMANGTADYAGYDVAPDQNCYIGNSAGLLPDGERSGVIA